MVSVLIRNSRISKPTAINNNTTPAIKNGSVAETNVAILTVKLMIMIIAMKQAVAQ